MRPADLQDMTSQLHEVKRDLYKWVVKNNPQVGLTGAGLANTSPKDKTNVLFEQLCKEVLVTDKPENQVRLKF